MVGRRGMSMVEVIIAGTLVLTLLIGTYSILSRGVQYARETEANSSAQQQSHQGMRSLVKEISNSVGSWSACAPGPDGWIQFLSAEPPLGQGQGPAFDVSTGRIIWRKHVCYWRDAATKTLVRAEIPFTTPASDLTSCPAPVVGQPNFVALPASGRRVMARGVEEFSAVPSLTANFDLTLKVRSLAAVATSSEAAKENQVNLSSSVTLINRFP